MFVSDLRHFLDMSADAPGPARRMGEHLTLVVRAATAGQGGQSWVTALPCRRRPGRRPCTGNLAVVRFDVPPSIEWRCTACGDEGVISGWERSPFDLRPRRPTLVSPPSVHAIAPPEVVATLRELLLLDTPSERLVFRARHTDEGLFIWAEHDTFAGPDWGRRACAMMPDARLEVLTGGHCPWTDHPQRCAELVSAFLEPADASAHSPLTADEPVPGRFRSERGPDPS